MSSDIPRTEALEGGVYGPENIEILRDLEHIRRRPGMFIGDTGSRGVHHLACALVANSVDEALAGFCRHIHLCLHADGSLSISDDGRGIPVEAHPGHCTTLEVMMTNPHVFHYRAGDDTQRVEVALQWTTSDAGLVLGFANSHYTHQGGTHLDGFCQAVTLSLQAYLRGAGRLPDRHFLRKRRAWQSGLPAVVAVYLQEPWFQGARKDKLGKPEVVEWFGAGLGPALDGFLRDHRDDTRAIADKVLTAPDMDRADPKTGYI